MMGNNEGSVEETLKQRGGVYGSYKEVVVARNRIANILELHHQRVQGCPMTGEMKVAIGDLVLKLVRGAGAPGYADSWHDLGGYAKLIEDMVKDNNTRGVES